MNNSARRCLINHIKDQIRDVLYFEVDDLSTLLFPYALPFGFHVADRSAEIKAVILARRWNDSLTMVEEIDEELLSEIGDLSFLEDIEMDGWRVTSHRLSLHEKFTSSRLYLRLKVQWMPPPRGLIDLTNAWIRKYPGLDGPRYPTNEFYPTDELRCEQ